MIFRIFPLYALSGFISLTYQLAWFRIFMDWFGSTSLTFGLVVANFIAGLGVGAYFSAPIANWVKRIFGIDDELRVYGVIEILVCLAALLTVVAGATPDSLISTFPYELDEGVWELFATAMLLRLGVAIFCVFVPFMTRTCDICVIDKT